MGSPETAVPTSVGATVSYLFVVGVEWEVMGTSFFS